MAELWYKTKEWAAYINNAYAVAESEPEDSEIYEVLANLRLAALEYNNGSLKFSKKEINSSELQAIQDNFDSLKKQVDDWLDTKG